MKNILKTVIGGTLFSVLLVSCDSESFNALNDDPKYAKELPSKNLLSTSLYNSASKIYTPSVNGNNYRFFVQQLAETTYTDETNYDFGRSQPRRFFNGIYSTGINNLKLAKKSLEKEVFSVNVKNNKWATLEIQELFLWETLVDTYGNIPYFEALKSDETLAPKYDDAFVIYKDLIKRIDAAVAKIDESVKGYGEADFIYKGNMTKWKRFANSIKLRLAINLSDVEPVLSKSVAESAVSSGVINSDSNSYSLIFDGSVYSNPVFDSFIASGRSDFIPTSFVVDMMNTRKDPRRAVWFTKVDGEYKGGIFGSKNNFSKYSHYQDVLTSANAPVKLLSYVEVEFLLAEAAARGYSVGTTAEEAYKKAITASMQEYKVGSDDITTYLAENPYDATDWKKSIGGQAYVALFDRAFATWNFTRRLDFPVLLNPKNSELGSVPFRMPYSDQEYRLNGDNVKVAAKAIGGDKAETKLFWDKN